MAMEYTQHGKFHKFIGQKNERANSKFYMRKEPVGVKLDQEEYERKWPKLNIILAQLENFNKRNSEKTTKELMRPQFVGNDATRKTEELFPRANTTYHLT